MFKNMILVNFPHVHFLCSGCNESKTEGDIRDMGRRLVEEVKLFLEEHINIIPGGAGTSEDSNQNILVNSSSSSTHQHGQWVGSGGGSALGSAESQNQPMVSFVGHSLGGLIIRAALPELRRVYGRYFHLFLSFSTAHLGLMYFFV